MPQEIFKNRPFQIRDLLKPNFSLPPYTTCIGRGRREPCRMLLWNKNIQLANQKIRELVEIFPKDLPSETHLIELATHLLCVRFHRSLAPKIAKAWKQDLSNSSEQNSEIVTEVTTPINLHEKFVHTSREQFSNSIVSAIVKAMRRPLSPLDIRHGFIHIGTRPGDPSLTKVGCTKEAMADLTLHSTRGCRFKVDHISYYLVQHYHRTERLVSCSLSENLAPERRSKPSKECNHLVHLWFKIDRKAAGLIVKRWQAWMELNPYNSDQLDPFWSAILFEAEKLPNLDAFYQWLDHTTQCCIDKGEAAWRGRTDGRFWNSSESLADKIQDVPISPTSSTASDDVPSMVSGTTSSSTLSSEQVPRAVELFVDWLLKDEVIQPLLAILAMNTTVAQKFEKNLGQILGNYSIRLRPEAQTPADREAIQFIRISKRSIANCLQRHTNPNWEKRSQQLQDASRQRADKDELLKRFGLTKPPLPVGTFDVYAKNDLERSDINPTMGDQRLNNIGWDNVDLDNMPTDDLGVDDMELDDSEHSDANVLPNLGLVREFMTKSEAFDKLRNDFKISIFPIEKHIYTSTNGMETQKLVVSYARLTKYCLFCSPNIERLISVEWMIPQTYRSRAFKSLPMGFQLMRLFTPMPKKTIYLVAIQLLGVRIHQKNTPFL